MNWTIATLLAVWDATVAKAAKTFLRDFVFKTNVFSDTEEIAIDDLVANRIMSPFSAIDGDGKVIARPGATSTTYTPPALLPKRILKASDAAQRLAGEDPKQAMDPAQRATEIMQKDMLFLYDANERRREWMRAQLLFKGSVAMVGDDYSHTLDFGLTTKATLTSHDLWSDIGDDSTSHPLANLDTWILAVAAASGVVPTVCVMALDVAKAFMAHPDVIAEAAKNQNVFVRLNPTDLAGYRGAKSLGFVQTPTGFTVEIMTYVEFYEDVAANGTITRYNMVPDNYLALFDPNDSFVMAYGAYVDLETEPATIYRKVDLPRTWYDKPRNQKYLQMVSRPLPAAKAANSWYAAKVL